MQNPKQDRDNLLIFIYEATYGTRHNISKEEVAAHFGWSGERLEAAKRYLAQKGFLNLLSPSTWAITAEGVDKAEEVLNLTQPSSTSSPAVVFNGPISGQVQIGNHNQATQTNNNAPSGELVESIVSALRDAGPTRSQLDRYIALLQSQNPSPQEVTNATGEIAGLSPTYRTILGNFVLNAASGAGSHWLVKAIETGLRVVGSYL